MMQIRKAHVVVAVLAAATAWADAALDNVSIAVSKASVAPNGQLGGFTYDLANDIAYTINFTAGGPTIFRKVTGAIDGTEQSSALIDEGQLQSFYRDGNANISAAASGAFALGLNPKAITVPLASGGTQTYQPNTFVVVVDGANTRFPSPSTTTNPAASKRFYRYTLDPLPAAATSPPVYGNILTPLTSLADVQAAAGTTNTASGSLLSRGFAYSSDGQSIYANNSSSALGGLYKLNLTTNALSRIYTANTSTSTFNTEPGVRDLGNGTDRVYFQGSVASGADGGLVSVDVGLNATTASAPAVVVQPSRFVDFFGLASATTDIRSVAVDSAGNIYCADQNTQSIIRVDPAGRLSKVLSRAERDYLRTSQLQTGNPVVSTGRLQFVDNRTVTAPNAAAGTLSVPRLLYVESGVDYIAQVFAYTPGDFNRDGFVTQTDIAAFKPALTIRNQPKPKLSDDYVYDLNGVSVNLTPSGSGAVSDYRSVVDFKDVKALQQFYAFRDGDADINQTVDSVDFNTLAANYGGLTKVWTQGDFNGDDTVDTVDFAILVANFGLALPTLPTAPALLPGAVVPEPAAGLLLTGAVSTIFRRRRAR